MFHLWYIKAINRNKSIKIKFKKNGFQKIPTSGYSIQDPEQHTKQNTTMTTVTKSIRSRKTESLTEPEKRKLKKLIEKHILTSGLYEKDIYESLGVSEPTYQKVKKKGIAAPYSIQKFRTLLNSQS